MKTEFLKGVQGHIYLAWIEYLENKKMKQEVWLYISVGE